MFANLSPKITTLILRAKNRMWFNGKSMFNALHMKILFILPFICRQFCPVSLDLSAIIHDSCSESHITRNKCTLIGPIDSTELNLQVTKVTLKEIFGRERKCENLPCCRCEKMKKNQPQFIGGWMWNTTSRRLSTSESFPQTKRRKCSDHEAPLNKGHGDWKNHLFDWNLEPTTDMWLRCWKKRLRERWWKFNELTSPEFGAFHHRFG